MQTGLNALFKLGVTVVKDEISPAVMNQVVLIVTPKMREAARRRNLVLRGTPKKYLTRISE
jgi:hypothetical protein